MKKQLVILIALIVASVLTLGAQSLTENPDYQKSLELKAEATTAFNAGDYDSAADLAAQAKEYAERSDQYVEKMLAKSRADKALSIAKDKIAWADSVKAKDRFPNEYATAVTQFSDSQTAYGTEDYNTATDKAREATATLDNLAALIAKADKDAADAAAQLKKDNTWPGVYIVRLIPQRRDCLWRIAEYPFIYNNPLKWTVIYEANKKTFRDPGNPNLIYPGQKLVIPSLRGENRDGTYDPDTTYKPFPKK
jgi:nucleoid-associated protein YgaU